MEPGERMRKERKEEESDYLCTCDLLAERAQAVAYKRCRLKLLNFSVAQYTA